MSRRTIREPDDGGSRRTRRDDGSAFQPCSSWAGFIRRNAECKSWITLLARSANCLQLRCCLISKLNRYLSLHTSASAGGTQPPSPPHEYTKGQIPLHGPDRTRVVEFSYNRLEPGNNRAVRSVPVQAEPSAAARRSVMVVVDVGCDDETPGWT